jgi:hypothetical protein
LIILRSIAVLMNMTFRLSFIVVCSGDLLERCYLIFGTNETWNLEIRVGVPNTLMHI